MTLLLPEVEADPLEHLDEDWAIACEFQITRTQQCGATATWWLICRACGLASAECSHHRTTESLTWGMAPLAPLACRRCRTIVVASNWRDLFIVEPIGVRP